MKNLDFKKYFNAGHNDTTNAIRDGSNATSNAYDNSDKELQDDIKSYTKNTQDAINLDDCKNANDGEKTSTTSNQDSSISESLLNITNLKKETFDEYLKWENGGKNGEWISKIV